MAKNLVIVESPTKAKTIGKFLGRNYKVMASVGHLRDLPKSTLGVDIENNFEPKYINVRGKAKTINELKKEAKKADRVLLASDPDREGEAIAWHLAYLLDLDLEDNNRVVFNEITKDKVKEAIDNPRQIDIALVNAQQARRIMDRIVGYKLSPILWKKVKSGLSAGRVQSVALKLIVDREEEIEGFVPEEYWSIVSKHKVDGIEFDSKYFGRFKNDKLEKVEIKNEKEVDEILSRLDHKTYKVIDVNKTKKTRNPYMPFTTSTMQQEASKRINFTTSKTMSVAQQLYEGINIGQEGSVGLISYMRTDSTRLSDNIVKEAVNFITDEYGKEYATKGKNYNKKKAGSQDAHEAIRPSSIYRTPLSIKSFLTNDQYKLYKLIWERTVASQMKPSRFESTRIDLDNKGEVFRANGNIMVFDGFTKVWSIAESAVVLPDLSLESIIASIKTDKNQHFTKPKPRFSEASLVKTLEENGIGRPSTYSSIIRSILSRNYVVLEAKNLIPTELGRTVNKLLLEYFSEIINEEFTAYMEGQLDKIEDENIDWKDLLDKFYKEFEKDLIKALESEDNFKIKDKPTGEKCPECGKDLVYKHGRNGKFIGCSGFPDCKFTKAIIKKTGVKCPKCGSEIVEKVSKRGKVFYGCSGYPKCDYATWDKPTGQVCKECGELMVHRKNRREDRVLCNNESCITNK